jgi:hypothetical protein
MVSLTKGGTGAIIRQPWTDGARPSDYSDPKRSRAGGRSRGKGRASPRPGARTGPVRGGRTKHGLPKRFLSRIGKRR